MSRQQFIIYCDESDESGRYYSHFYGGALLKASDRELITQELNDQKQALNLHNELKWTYISKPYEQKYKDFIDTFFNLIESGRIKIRIMFTQNIHVPNGLEEYQLDHQYFLLYYQMIKHAFGLRYCNPDALNEIFVSLYLDDVPDTQEKFDQFKRYMNTLCEYPVFSGARIKIPLEDITDVKSHDHVILQGLDIILGAMQFRLNDKHLAKPPGQRTRGKRTLAKERVYKHINSRIRMLYPNFNIGMSTGQSSPEDKWNHHYRHWSFRPSDCTIDLSRGKRRNK